MELKKFSAETHQGPFLNLNEDGYDFDLDQELFMIFDGFGGNGVGDKVVEELKTSVKKFYQNFVEDRNATLPFFYSPKFTLEGNALINSALFSHEKIFKANQIVPIAQRGGASGIIMAKFESLITLLFVGSCRGYLLRRGKLTKLCEEDTHRHISFDSLDSHLKNMPLSGFGLFPDLYYQVKEVRVVQGDKLVLMTDGVFGRMDEDEVKASVSQYTVNIKSKVHQMFQLSNQRGNLDNQTCMILEY
ncbi:MAG: hypothetical protein CME65_11015 [Halobacteriovoraceae bacterium]|nr:hypothetical protein [Halobacteriovoraceae bacterium]|tara:strand:- start:6083 stop:6820 length:738 start_codon:yes stop_codon:yes gene_type:complete